MTLYLKYRPQDFSSLVGQDFIKTTLKKAVSQDKTVGAYMFTGPRGTGKTSTARIFAKAINCTNIKNGDPCLNCQICTSAQEDSLIDIIEIDAASHTGVDNIREIIERAQFQPSHAKYKVYIIDEVHMLSKGAFNALLKILEEPPKHVKFILATTDIHKVPDTILSRCQRYDFTNFVNEEIQGRLEYIAKEEGIKVDKESYEYIVSSAEGGMRNALSLFEQLIVDNNISFTYIANTLGVSKIEEQRSFLSKILKKDTSALEDFTTLAKEGKNLKNFIKEILYLMQEKIEKKLISGEQIASELQTLEILEESLRKTKTSFDESLTLQIGLYKILGGHSNQQTLDTKVEINQTTTSKVMGQNTQDRSVEQEVNMESVEDIFGSASVESSVETVEKVSKPVVNTSKEAQESGDFDITSFISAVKAAGGKAALIMSLKGSKFAYSQDTLSINANTKISRNTLEKLENREILLQVGESFGTPFTALSVS